MVLKYDNLLIYSGSSLSNGKWIQSTVSLYEDGTLKVRTSDVTTQKNLKSYVLSSEWFTIAPRINSLATDLPVLANKKQQCEIFALTKPPDITIWFLTSSKQERDQWIELILPLITFKTTTPTELPPPYSEYDNLTYYPWDTSSTVCESQQTQPSPFQFTPSFSHHSGSYTVQKTTKEAFVPPRSFSPHRRSGFYSVQKHSKKIPQATTLVSPVAPETPVQTHIDESSRKNCCRWCSIGMAYCCNLFFLCMHQCCSNFSAAF